MTKLIQEQQNTVFDTLKGSFGWTSKMQTPRITKVVVTSGIGKIKEKAKIALIADRLAKITGQKPANRTAKQAIASFKTRIGDLIGYQVTLRGKRADDFVNRLIHISFPRTKDFKGIATTGIDSMGNYSIGIKDHTIFPETADEDVKDVFGLGITITTTAKTPAEAKAYLSHLGMPFVK